MVMLWCPVCCISITVPYGSTWWCRCAGGPTQMIPEPATDCGDYKLKVVMTI